MGKHTKYNCRAFPISYAGLGTSLQGYCTCIAQVEILTSQILGIRPGALCNRWVGKYYYINYYSTQTWQMFTWLVGKTPPTAIHCPLSGVKDCVVWLGSIWIRTKVCC